MAQKFISGILLIGLSTFLGIFFCDFALQRAKTKSLNNYFCSRTDNASYNVQVQFILNEIRIENNWNQIQKFEYDNIINKLNNAKRHRLLTSIQKKIKTKTTFNFKVDRKLGICGFYDEGIYFTEAYVFNGNIENFELFDLITNPQIEWPETTKQDKDLVYAVIYLFVNNLFNLYTFKFYKDFVIISDYLEQDLYRLDIDYKEIFDINLINNKNTLLYELTQNNDDITLKSIAGKLISYSFSKIVPQQNTISTILGKNCTIEIDLDKFIKHNGFEEIKNIPEVKKSKEDKQFMNFINNLKGLLEKMNLGKPNEL